MRTNIFADCPHCGKVHKRSLLLGQTAKDIVLKCDAMSNKSEEEKRFTVKYPGREMSLSDTSIGAN